MLDPRHLLRAKRWVQNPPSTKRIKLILGVLVVVTAIVALERFDLWPLWAHADRIPRRF